MFCSFSFILPPAISFLYATTESTIIPIRPPHENLTASFVLQFFSEAINLKKSNKSCGFQASETLRHHQQ